MSSRAGFQADIGAIFRAEIMLLNGLSFKFLRIHHRFRDGRQDEGVVDVEAPTPARGTAQSRRRETNDCHQGPPRTEAGEQGKCQVENAANG